MINVCYFFRPETFPNAKSTISLVMSQYKECAHNISYIQVYYTNTFLIQWFSLSANYSSSIFRVSNLTLTYSKSHQIAAL